MKKKMLVIVDFQNDFVDGSLGFSDAVVLDQLIEETLKNYLEENQHIVVTRDTHFDDYLDTREGKNLPITHCIHKTHGWELYGKTGQLVEENKEKVYFVDKEAFGVDPENMLKIKNKFDVDEIEMVGLVSNICVLSNVCCFQAAFPHATITVHSNKCDSADKEIHKKTIDVLKGIQVNVR